MGNDYVDARKFENIYSHISVPKSKSMSDQHRRIAGLLEFLRGESVEDAIDRVIFFNYIFSPVFFFINIFP